MSADGFVGWEEAERLLNALDRVVEAGFGLTRDEEFYDAAPGIVRRAIEDAKKLDAIAELVEHTNPWLDTAASLAEEIRAVVEGTP